ncbi:uncharacterized mitochondrial protein AtMg00810-like [Gossypium hirsutum]|uniref:Uncharacterized mitochondrial protein AtMg00810-like n=1 Tax=Gossypium hirsutum TaxID=3635 RepID=A0A1U8PAG4_GOSHI|nr:uncharacterized mitochondrial protein AtMg00810-like [Gossypium hirsutum]
MADKFVVSKADNSLFIRQEGSQLLYVLIYVDDIVVISTNPLAIDRFVKDLDVHFSLKDLSHLNYFLGIEVTYTLNGNLMEDERLFRSIVGALQYVVITRPDSAFSINKVCQYMHKPLDTHFKVVKRILRHLQGTLEYGLQFTHNSKLLLESYSDESWGSDIDDHRSTSGFCVFLGGNPISWSSKKQQVVSRSTAEAEYRSLAHVAAEI